MTNAATNVGQLRSVLTTGIGVDIGGLEKLKLS
jgi:hypothetical protein